MAEVKSVHGGTFRSSVMSVLKVCFLITRHYFVSLKRLTLFYQKFHHLPRGLECNDFSILNLNRRSRVGAENRLLVSEGAGSFGAAKTEIRFGEGTWTGRNVEISVLKGLSVVLKDFVSLQDGCKVIGDVLIERYCLLAPNVFLSSGRHYAIKGDLRSIRLQDKLHLSDERDRLNHSQRIHIEEDCWIGYSSFVQAGVYIGRGAIIGANTVVTKRVAPYAIVVGANLHVGNRLLFAPPDSIMAEDQQHWPYFYRGFVHPTKISDLQEKKFLFRVDSTGECVFVLKKNQLLRLDILGELVGQENLKFVIRIFSNGTLRLAECQTNDDGNFCANVDLHLETVELYHDNDQVFNLRDEYNVYKLKFEVPGEQEHVILINKISQLASI